MTANDSHGGIEENRLLFKSESMLEENKWGAPFRYTALEVPVRQKSINGEFFFGENDNQYTTTIELIGD